MVQVISVFLLYPLFILLPYWAHAQDGHYWTQNFGTKSMLLGNSVVGGVEDLGLVYYNPARLAVIKKPAFLMSADVYEWNSFKFKDVLGDSKNLSSTNFRGLPNFVAGAFKLKGLKKHRFAYAFLVRQRFDVDVTFSEEVDNSQNEQVDNLFFNSTIGIKQRINEEWTSLTWSYLIKDNLSFGLMAGISTINQQKSNSIGVNALADSSNVTAYLFDRSYGFERDGFILKAGLSYQLKQVLLGFTLLTPRMNFSGSGGSYTYREQLSGSSGEDFFTSSVQKNLKAAYKSPWAVAVGASFPVKFGKLHFSSEWYSGVPAYMIFEAEDHQSQSNGSVKEFRLVDDLRSVLNVGFGVEILLSENWSAYGSFSTDFSAAPNEFITVTEIRSIANNTALRANYFHTAGGVVAVLKQVSVTLGASYTSGSERVPRLVDFPEEGNDNHLDRANASKLVWNRLRLVVSLSVPFIRELEKRILD
ncbi:MAG: long-chain fatty acid transport protein [Cyclobacteriaceae bacterium]